MKTKKQKWLPEALCIFFKTWMKVWNIQNILHQNSSWKPKTNWVNRDSVWFCSKQHFAIHQTKLPNESQKPKFGYQWPCLTSQNMFLASEKNARWKPKRKNDCRRPCAFFSKHEWKFEISRTYCTNIVPESQKLTGSTGTLSDFVPNNFSQYITQNFQMKAKNPKMGARGPVPFFAIYYLIFSDDSCT